MRLACPRGRGRRAQSQKRRSRYPARHIRRLASDPARRRDRTRGRRGSLRNRRPGAQRGRSVRPIDHRRTGANQQRHACDHESRCNALVFVTQHIPDPRHLCPRDLGMPALELVRQTPAGFGNGFDVTLHQPALAPVAFEASIVTPAISVRMRSIASRISVSRERTTRPSEHLQRRRFDLRPQNLVEAVARHVMWKLVQDDLTPWSGCAARSCRGRRRPEGT